MMQCMIWLVGWCNAWYDWLDDVMYDMIGWMMQCMIWLVGWWNVWYDWLDDVMYGMIGRMVSGMVMWLVGWVGECGSRRLLSVFGSGQYELSNRVNWIIFWIRLYIIYNIRWWPYDPEMCLMLGCYMGLCNLHGIHPGNEGLINFPPFSMST